jgi:ubiquinone/menaquinone biosynthesis C-methylase UbiE
MSDEATGFVGSIPEYYDRGLGPIFFTDYAEHTAHLVASYAPSRVLETGAGTGIVTRRLRDLLPATTRLIATDLNPPMLDVARKKFHPNEPIEFQQADAMALPFADASFDAVVCQFSAQFFPDKEKSYSEAHRVLAPGAAMYSASGTAATTGMPASLTKSPPNFSRPIRRNFIGSGRATTK